METGSSRGASGGCGSRAGGIVVLRQCMVLAVHIFNIVVELNVYLYNSGQGIRNIELVGQCSSSVFVEARAEVSNLLFLVHGEFGADSDKLSGIGGAVSLTLMEFVKFFSCCCFSI